MFIEPNTARINYSRYPKVIVAANKSLCNRLIFINLSSGVVWCCLGSFIHNLWKDTAFLYVYLCLHLYKYLCFHSTQTIVTACNEHTFAMAFCGNVFKMLLHSINERVLLRWHLYLVGIENSNGLKFIRRVFRIWYLDRTSDLIYPFGNKLRSAEINKTN